MTERYLRRTDKLIIYYTTIYSLLQNATEPEREDKKFVACVPSTSPRGHTGYLTTATYLMENQLPQMVKTENTCEN